MVALSLPAQQRAPPPFPLTTLPRISAPLRRARTTQTRAARPPPRACLALRCVSMPSAWLPHSFPAQQPTPPPLLLTILPLTSAPSRRAGTTQPLAARPPPRASLALRCVIMPSAWLPLRSPAQQRAPPPFPLNHSPPHLRAISQGTYNPNTGQIACFSCAAVRLHAQRVVAPLLPAQQPIPPPFLLSIPPHISAPSRRASTTQIRAARPPPRASLAQRCVSMFCPWSLFRSPRSSVSRPLHS